MTTNQQQTLGASLTTITEQEPQQALEQIPQPEPAMDKVLCDPCSQGDTCPLLEFEVDMEQRDFSLESKCTIAQVDMARRVNEQKCTKREIAVPCSRFVEIY